MQREISAGIIVYRNTAQGVKFLLLYHGGGYWNFPKGHIEGEEKSLQAAIRETAEEAGLKRNDLKINNRFKFYDKFTFFRGKVKIFKIVILYLAETKNRRIHISHEHDGFGWFSYKEAVKLLSKYKDSVELLKKAQASIPKAGGRQGPPGNSRQHGAGMNQKPAPHRQPAYRASGSTEPISKPGTV